MTFLPIVARELRVAARRRSTYYLRAAAGLVVLAALTWLFIMMRQDPPQQLANVLFGVLTGGAFLYALLSGVRSTADCLSQEKREGTFGLLFLTDLKGYDVVLGKLVSNSVRAFYSLLAILPMLALPLLIGGVAPAEFGRMAVVAVNALFFSLALGICVSAMSRSGQRAVLATLGLVLVIAGALPAIAALLAYFGKAPQPPLGLLLPSPGFGYYMAFDANYKTNPNAFWISMAIVHGLGWLALALASVVAPRSWQDRPAGARRIRWREGLKRWSYGPPAERALFRRQLLDINAFYWLAARVRTKPAYVWGLLALIAGIWAWGLAKNGREWLNVSLYGLTALGVNFWLRCWLASEAVAALAEERRTGSIELLLSTPLKVREILRGERLALMRQFFGPVCAVLVVECLFTWGSMTDEEIDRSSRPVVLLGWFALMATLIADMVALYWVGMWQALSARASGQAVSATLARILVFPWVLIGLALVALVILGMLGFGLPDFFFGHFIALWAVAGLAADLGFGISSRKKLLTQFRLAAQQRFAPRVSLWSRWFAGGQPGLPPELKSGRGTAEPWEQHLQGGGANK